MNIGVIKRNWCCPLASLLAVTHLSHNNNGGIELQYQSVLSLRVQFLLFLQTGWALQGFCLIGCVIPIMFLMR
jgi:hypothetical protein